MKTFDGVIARFDFRPPADYMRFLSAGALANDFKTGMRVSRLSWRSPKEIDSCLWPEYKIKSLVPCAQTPGRDHYCWSLSDHPENPWIAECPRDSDFAEGFAPHFEGFVFRALLEEMSGTWLTDDPNTAARMFRLNADRSRAGLRHVWAEILDTLASRPVTFNQANSPRVISEEYAAQVVNSELAFPMLGKQFKQHLD
ncbi:MAG TPA: hypothetical protein VN541_00055 [Tepidisphaeraceae bacterium]|nr:hypothetical protein [Tepidisphaeraceae bacterium]